MQLKQREEQLKKKTYVETKKLSSTEKARLLQQL